MVLIHYISLENVFQLSPCLDPNNAMKDFQDPPARFLNMREKWSYRTQYPVYNFSMATKPSKPNKPDVGHHLQYKAQFREGLGWEWLGIWSGALRWEISDMFYILLFFSPIARPCRHKKLFVLFRNHMYFLTQTRPA